MIMTKSFNLPDRLNATKPPEQRGIKRSQVKLMVSDKKSKTISHDCFFNLENYLRRGDLLILNNSRTIPAVVRVDIRRKNSAIEKNIEMRLARNVDDYSWDVLLLTENIHAGDSLIFQNGMTANIKTRKSDSPLYTISFTVHKEMFMQYVYRYGEPIRYEYINHPYDISYYQTVFASVPGSVELPSAGRAFDWDLLFKLQKKGIQICYIQLHTSLSYMLEEYWPLKPQANPEYYNVPNETLHSIEQTKQNGNKVIAVGTTVVRALETALRTDEKEGVTNLYIGADDPIQSVDGILTGFHEPEASHLDMLSAFIDIPSLLDSYQVAIRHRYLWHEFGDMHLII